jgi:hypothetical protein
VLLGGWKDCGGEKLFTITAHRCIKVVMKLFSSW